MKLPISAIVLTYNEEKNIEDCLSSISGWLDEVFVVDSGSSDKTIEIARRYTDKIYEHPFESFGKQRNWAQENLPIRNEWIFHLDADERPSQELVSRLKEIFSSNNDIDGVMIPRRIIFRGRWMKHGGMYPSYHLRIFKKSKGKCQERLYDQHYIVGGNKVIVDADIINIITSDLSTLKSRHRKWAGQEAQEILFNKNVTLNTKFNGNPIERKNWIRYNIYYKIPLFIRPSFYFLYRFIVRLGFLDGREGLLYHFWQGFWYRFLVDIEIYKIMTRKTKIP